LGSTSLEGKERKQDCAECLRNIAQMVGCLFGKCKILNSNVKACAEGQISETDARPVDLERPSKKSLRSSERLCPPEWNSHLLACYTDHSRKYFLCWGKDCLLYYTITYYLLTAQQLGQCILQERQVWTALYRVHQFFPNSYHHQSSTELKRNP
jgi:hypothetical protein